MADSDTDSDPSEAPDEAVDEPVGANAEPAAGPEAEADVGRTDLKVTQARKTLEEEAEAARRRVLGSRRGRGGPATLTPPAPTDDNVDMSEHLRELVRGVEEETERLHEEVFRLRSAAGRAGATLQDEIQRAAGELVEQTATESLETLNAAAETLQETAEALTEATAGLRTSVEQLASLSPVAQQLAELAAEPPSIPDALASILGDLTEQLGALGDAVSSEVRASLEEALTAELARHDARIEHALARVVDELARLRRRLPVTKKGAAVDLTKAQLENIGQAVGDYLLAAMREQKN